MKFARVFLKGSDNPLRWVDVPLEGTPFGSFCMSVVVQGAILPQPSWQGYVPRDEIKFMFEIESGAPSLAGMVFEHMPPGKAN